MAKILLAWELGTGFGHLVSLRALAQELRKRGHECVFAVRHLASAQEFIEPELGPAFQAPVRLGGGHNPVKTQVSYASLLHNVAADDTHDLAGRIAAWRELMKALRVTHVLADHGPLALIAARTLSLPACYVGSGFTVPPAVTPFPSFRPAMTIPDKVLAHNDAEVLKELNWALERLKLAPFGALQDILSAARPALLSYEALDHYEMKRPEPFLGMPDYSHGAAPEWPEGNGPKIFAYLRPSAALEPTVQALAKSRARVLLRLSGAAPAQVKQYLRPGMSVVGSAISFRRAAEACDFFVNYGAHSTVCEFLLAGKPGMLVPDLHERVLTSRRAVQLGACTVARGKEPGPYVEAMAKMLQDASLRGAAERFAKAAAAIDRNAILPKLVTDFLG